MKKEIILSEEQKENFGRFLELSDKYKSSYFWGDNGNAARRNYIENRDYINYDTVVDGVEYSVYFSVSLSRNSVYVTKTVTRAGEKTTARVIKTLLDKAV